MYKSKMRIIRTWIASLLCAAMMVQSSAFSAYALEANAQDAILQADDEVQIMESVEFEQEDEELQSESDVESAQEDEEVQPEENLESVQEDVKVEVSNEEANAMSVQSGIVTLTFESGEHYKVYRTRTGDSYSDEITDAIELDVSYSFRYEYEVYYVADSGYTIASVRAESSDSVKDRPKLRVKKLKDDYSELHITTEGTASSERDYTIKAKVEPINDVTLSINTVGADINSCTLNPGDSKALINDSSNFVIKNNQYMTMDIIPNGAVKPYVYMLDEFGDREDYALESYDSERNVYSYSLGRFFSDSTVYVETKPMHSVTFDVKNGLKVRQITDYDVYEDEEEGKIFDYFIDEETSGSVNPEPMYTDKGLLFTVSSKNVNRKYGSIKVTANGMEIPSVRSYDYYEETPYFLAVTEDTTVTVEYSPRKLPLEYASEAIESVSMSGTKSGTVYDDSNKAIHYDDDDALDGLITLKEGYLLKGIRYVYMSEDVDEEQYITIPHEAKGNGISFSAKIPCLNSEEGDMEDEDLENRVWIRKIQIVTEKKPEENEDNRKKVVFSYKEGAISDIKVSVKGVEIEPVKTVNGGSVNLEYLIKYGDTADYVITAEGSFKISAMDVFDELDTKDIDKSGEKVEGSILVDSNLTLNIYTKAKVSVVLTEIKNNKRTDYPNNTTSSYQITESNIYEFKMFFGGEPVSFSTMKASPGGYANVNWNPSNPELITIEPHSLLKPETTRRIRVYVTYTINDVRQSDSYLFVIGPELKNLTFRNVNSNTIENQQDSRLVCIAVPNPINANIEMVGIETEYNSGYSENNLKIIMQSTKRGIVIESSPSTPIGEGARIKLYRANLEPADPEYYINNGEYKINVIEPKSLTEGSVLADYVYSNDTTVTLNLTRPDGVKTPLTGKQYYECKVVPQAKKDIETPATVIGGTFYIERDIQAEDEYFDKIFEIDEEYLEYAQPVTLKLNTSNDYRGQAWDYDITVSMVQIADKSELIESNAASLITYRSKPVTLMVSTQEPVYETNLRVKASKDKVFTGQKDAKLAELVFSEKTVCRDAFAEDITTCSEDEKLSIRIENGTLYADIGLMTKIGKHTIKITPAGPSDMYKASKTVTVNVVRGIESLEINSNTEKIVKLVGKAASVKLGITYNNNETVPSKKQVEWLIVDEEGNPISDSSISVKNGTVKITKDRPSNAVDSFYVKAIAKDYVGNKVTALSNEIAITNEPTKLGDVIVVRLEADNLYHIVEGNPIVMTSDEWAKSQILVLDKSVTPKNTYSVDDIADEALSTDLYSVVAKDSKSILLTETESGVKVDATALVKQTDITFTSTDGGNQKKSITVGVKSMEPKQLGLQLSQGENVLGDTKAETVSFNGTVNTVLTLQLMCQTENDNWVYPLGIIKHSVKVKNGAIVRSDVKNGTYDIIVTGKSAVVTLTDNFGKKKNYTVTNDTYSPQKPTSVKVSGTLISGTDKEQILTLKLPDGYNTEGKRIVVEMNKKSAMKLTDNYELIAAACHEIGKGAENNNFKQLHFSGINLPEGSYKMDVTIGSIQNGIFVAEMKPVTITIKVSKPKVVKGSYKLNKKVKMSLKPGSNIEISGTGKNSKVLNINSIQASNYNRNSNRFLEFFELDSTSSKLVLKSGLSQEQLEFIASREGAVHRIGYVTYTYEHGDDGYGNKNVAVNTDCIQIEFK